jgi:subtilisin family serine protease
VAARSRSTDGTIRMSGTSMAAPAVTGSVALLLAEAAGRGSALAVDVLRQHVNRTARTDPPAPNAERWDPRFGHGRVSATGLVATQIP